jgi:tetratricopeptide (TPR) repeat protein
VFWRSANVASIGPIPSSPPFAVTALNQARAYELLFGTGMIIILGLMIVIALSLSQTSQPMVRSTTNGTWVMAGLVSLLVATSSWILTVNPLRAAVNLGWAEALDETGRLNASAEVYRRAIALNQRSYFYRALLSEVLIKLAKNSPDNDGARNFFAEAENVLLDTRKLSDLNRSSFYLGRLYLIWADRETGSAKQALVEKAVAVLQQARTFEPNVDPVLKLSSIADEMVSGHSGDRAP